MEQAVYQKSPAALAGTAVYPIAVFAVSIGIPSDTVEAALGSSLLNLIKDSAMVDVRRINALWALVERQSAGPEAASIAMGRATCYSFYRGLGRGASFAPSVREALQHLCRFSTMLSPHLELQLDESQNCATFSFFDPSDTLSNGHTNESGPVILWKWVRDWVAQDVRPNHVFYINSRCGPLDSYTSYFRTNVTFNHKAERGWIEFDRSVLDLPLRTSDPVGFAVSQKLSAIHMKHHEIVSNDEILREVKQAVYHGAKDGIFDVTTAVESAQVPMRTAQRRAARQGLHLLDFVQQRRAEIACIKLIKDPETSLSELVVKMGYSDERALRRSFKRWTGASPASFKNAFLPRD
ncbi:MAG: AraC family transcriptional regulator ligand-binding domain-containing protein [Pseudomonadota bacterium]